MKHTKVYNKIRNRYFFAFSLIALLAIGAFINLYYSISSQFINAELINLSGKQRMLSQRIALFAEHFQRGDFLDAKDELQKAIFTMEKDHTYLMEHTSSDEILKIYKQQPNELHKKVEYFLTMANALLSKDEDIKTEELFAKSQELLPILDHVVKRYQAEDEAKTEMIKKFETVILTITLITLMIEAWFIFKPSIAELEYSAIKEKAYLSELRNNSIDTLVRSIAHQWRQPLNSIVMNMVMIRDEAENNEIHDDIEQYASNIDKEVLYLTGTINSINNLFKHIDKGKNSSIGETIESVIYVMKEQLIEEQILISAQHEKLELFGDPGDFVQCLIGLIDNSRDSIKKRREEEPEYNGKIEIEAKSENHAIEVTIKDNGTGVPQEMMERVFEPYSTEYFQSRGKGLSMFIIKSVIEKRFGGSIELQNLENGAIVTMLFPKNPA